MPTSSFKVIHISEYSSLNSGRILRILAADSFQLHLQQIVMPLNLALDWLLIIPQAEHEMTAHEAGTALLHEKFSRYCPSFAAIATVSAMISQEPLILQEGFSFLFCPTMTAPIGKFKMIKFERANHFLLKTADSVRQIWIVGLCLTIFLPSHPKICLFTLHMQALSLLPPSLFFNLGAVLYAL